MIDKLIEKLVEEFEDVFKPASEEELEGREYYDEDELAEFLINVPLEKLSALYWDYVGPLHYKIAREIIEEMPDAVLHKLYMKIKDQRDFEIDLDEIEQWTKEEGKKKSGKTTGKTYRRGL